ncbi:hypothetical protein GCM10022267_00630 [Lentzea roselyniae]|uniref:Uncharacterized protein n=1 Tax=Lentzea roselyniae TaxID=531940 RepID=A0ABP6ZT91_9PSEU
MGVSFLVEETPTTSFPASSRPALDGFHSQAQARDADDGGLAGRLTLFAHPALVLNVCLYAGHTARARSDDPERLEPEPDASAFVGAATAPSSAATSPTQPTAAFSACETERIDSPRTRR